MASFRFLFAILVALSLFVGGFVEGAREHELMHKRYAEEFASDVDFHHELVLRSLEDTESNSGSGSNETSSTTGSASGSEGYYNWESIVFSILLIVFGFGYCFFGYRLFHILLFVLGWIIGAGLFYNILSAHTDLSTTAVVLLAIFIGVVFGLIAVILWFVGLFALGACAGLIVISAILSMKQGSLIPKESIRITVIVIFCLICGILALWLQRFFIIISTSVSGSYFIIVAIDYFIKGNLNQFIPALFKDTLDTFQTDWKTWLMLALFIVLSISGIVVQLIKTSKDYEFKPLVHHTKLMFWRKHGDHYHLEEGEEVATQYSKLV